MSAQNFTDQSSEKKTWLWLLIIILMLGGLWWAFNERKNTRTIDETPDTTLEQTAPSEEESASAVATQPTERPIVILKTNQGEIELELFRDLSPNTVENFLRLSQTDFYDGIKFHRVIKGFMVQGGDPNSMDDNWSDDGMGGPGYTFADEFNDQPLTRGSLAMANAGPNTNGSQFFIVTADATPWLDGKHTNFGRVITGYEVVEAIEKSPVNEQDHPIEDVVIIDIVVK